MRISTLVISVLLVGILVTGMYGFLGDLADTNAYDVSYDTKYETTFNDIENVSEDIRDKYNTLQNLSGDKGSSIGVITLTVDAMILIKDVITLPFAIISDMVLLVLEYMGVPDWVETFILGIIAAAVVFGFIALLLRFKET